MDKYSRFWLLGTLGLPSHTFALSPEIKPFALIEVEASALKKDSTNESDITLATFNPGFDVKLGDTFSARGSLLYEEDATELEVDEAYIQWDFAADFNGKFGQMYLPFGQFNTELVNDTLVQSLAETRESSAVFTYSHDALLVAAYVYNGEVDGYQGSEEENLSAPTGDSGSNGYTGKVKPAKDRADNYGLRLGYKSEDFNLAFDYTSNLLDSDGIQGQASVLAANGTAAWILTADATLGACKLMGEYLTGTVKANNVTDAEKNLVGQEQKLRASQFEVSYSLDPVVLAASYQTTADALWLGLPKTRLALGAGFKPEEGIGVKLELWHDDDYSLEEGGTDEDSLGLVAQLSLQF